MRKVFLSFFLCPLITSTANAQSAWVLWERRDGKDYKKWDIVLAYPTYQECTQARDHWFNLSPSGEKFEEVVKSAPSAPDPNCPECIWVDISKSGEKRLAFIGRKKIFLV